MNLIAHRGISAHYHENTLLAFEKALEVDVLGIEVDLHQIDNEFVIFHDFALNRLVSTSGEVADLSLVEIDNLRLKDGSKIPRLNELFSLAQGKCLLNLELKHVVDPAILIEKVTQYIYQFDGEIVISSFNHHLLKNVQALLRDTRVAHKVKIGALVGHLPLDYAQYAVTLQADIAAIDADLVTADFVQHAHTYGLEVWSYTVNTEKGLKKLKEMGVDAVFSNDPALLKSFLG